VLFIVLVVNIDVPAMRVRLSIQLFVIGEMYDFSK